MPSHIRHPRVVHKRCKAGLRAWQACSTVALLDNVHVWYGLELERKKEVSQEKRKMANYIIAKEGELPEILEKNIWNRPIEGLFITSALTLLAANLFDLSSISMMGSAGFLLIFAAVNGANVRLYEKTASRRWIAVFGVVICSCALGALIWQRATTSPRELWVLGIMMGLAFAIEAVYRGVTGGALSRSQVLSSQAMISCISRKGMDPRITRTEHHRSSKRLDQDLYVRFSR